MYYTSCSRCKSQNRQTDKKCYSCGASLAEKNTAAGGAGRLDQSLVIPPAVTRAFTIEKSDDSITLVPKHSELVLGVILLTNAILWPSMFLFTFQPAYLIFALLFLALLPKAIRCLTVRTSWVLQAGRIQRVDRQGQEVSQHDQSGKQLRAFLQKHSKQLYFMDPGDAVYFNAVRFMNCKTSEETEVREWLEKTSGVSLS